MAQSVRFRLIESMRLFAAKCELGKLNKAYRDNIKKELIATGYSGDLLSDEVLVKNFDDRQFEMLKIMRLAESSKVIMFPSGQASVFLDAIRKIDFGIDYALPFPVTLLQFSDPILVDLSDPHVPNKLQKKELGALLLWQDKDDSGKNNNVIFVLEKDLSHYRIISWHSSDESLLMSGELSNDEFNQINEMTLKDVRRLAVACIGYINCENVYLHKEGEVSDAINTKRERKGKSRLEPYYVCRIRGVQYDSEGYEKGAGVKHGIRYDVRGHFRRLETGKTIWVRPHQRGLQNELYVPKTYVVAKEPHQ